MPAATTSPNGNNIVRVVAYNFLSGGSRKRSGHWSRLTRTLAAELVLAQECRAPAECPGEKFRPGPQDSLLWQPVEGRRWGSAILSRSAALTPLSLPGFAGWVVGGEVSIPILA